MCRNGHGAKNHNGDRKCTLPGELDQELSQIPLSAGRGSHEDQLKGFLIR